MLSYPLLPTHYVATCFGFGLVIGARLFAFVLVLLAFPHSSVPALSVDALGSVFFPPVPCSVQSSSRFLPQSSDASRATVGCCLP
jgi:hypothetical protein